MESWGRACCSTYQTLTSCETLSRRQCICWTSTFVKGLSGRVFNSGTAAQTMHGYRRTSIAELSNLVRYVLKNPINISLLLAHNYVNIHFNCLDRNIRYPTDFPRRAREYDHASWKAHEWRQHGLFHLPIILRCSHGRRTGRRASTWHSPSSTVLFVSLTKSM